MKTAEGETLEQVVKDIKYLIKTDCNDETLSKRISNHRTHYAKEVVEDYFKEDFGVLHDTIKQQLLKRIEDGK